MSTKDKIEIISLDQYLELKKGNFEFEGQSYLFWEYVRLLNETKPKYFLLENVKMSKKWKDVITKILGVEPILINSSLVSAQNRNRLYWTNIPDVVQPKNKNLYFKDVKDFVGPYTIWNDDKMKKWFNKEYVRKDYYRIEVDDSKVQCLMAQSGTNRPKCWYKENKNFRFLTPLEYERLQTVSDNYTDNISTHQRYKCLGNGWTVDVIAHILKNINNA